MALARTRAVGLIGVTGFVVDVEVDIASGLPQTTLTGLPDSSCAQSPARVRAATANCGVPVPPRRLTINLSPASVPKIGSGFDLAIAVAVLAAAGHLPAALVDGVVHIGELALDGAVRPVRGVLPLVLAARSAGLRCVVVPSANAAEARLVDGVEVVPAAHLRQLVGRYVDLAAGRNPAASPVPDETAEPQEPTPPDLAEVAGQVEARMALEIAAAGGHHLALVGPPGAGKTMLAERLPGILPTLDERDGLEVAAIASVLGLLSPGPHRLPRRPPFVAPHHAASVAAVIGGGSGLARPGAITQAHRGVLFLDEAPEFSGEVLQALRQPLESGEVVLARAKGAVRFPSRFQLVLAANPCPCGRAYGKGAACTCSPMNKRRYQAKLGGPLVDRVDLQVPVDLPTRAALARGAGEPSAVVAARVLRAREIQAGRLAGTGWQLNRDVPGPALRQGRFALPPGRLAALDEALDRGWLTLRGYDRCLRVAWTIRDLAGGGAPTGEDVETALTLRRTALAAA